MIFTGAEYPSGQTLKNIVIEDNEIDCPLTPHGITAKNVDGLYVRGNKIISKDEPVVIAECTNVCCKDGDHS